VVSPFFENQPTPLKVLLDHYQVTVKKYGVDETPSLFLIDPQAGSLSAHGQDERTITILYSSSLNGNLDGCDCKGHPRGGLVKRAAWLLTPDQPERILLVDAGDLLDPYPDPDLAKAIFDTYLELGYTAIALGDQEFANGLESLLEHSSRFRLFSWQDDPDDPAVRRRIDEYKHTLRERLSSR
jgi:hypothetical protein